MKLLHFLAFFCFSIPLSAQNSGLYFPPKLTENWQMESPDILGFCPERIDSLYHFLADADSKSFILLHDGKIVLEKYFGTYQRDSFWYWASAGKSLAGFLVGQARDEGLLELTDKTSDYLGVGWTAAPAAKEELITVWNQITMTTGLDDNVTNQDCTDPSCLTYKADAGTRWAYHNAPYHLVHDVIEAASGLSLQQFTKTRLFDKTGMRGLWFDHVQYGRARDMARFGLLVQANGIWDGDTLLHDSNYLYEMTHPSQNLNKSYGYLWWLNGQESYMLPGLQLMIPGPLCPNAPADMFAALGKNDQKIHVVPSKGWIVVRQGNSANAGPVPVQFDNLMWAYLNALECTSPVVEAKNEDEILIYPTIATDHWKIESTAEIQEYTLWDFSGKLIAQQQFQIPVKNYTIAIPQLYSGFYVLQLKTTQGRFYTRKIITAN